MACDLSCLKICILNQNHASSFFVSPKWILSGHKLLFGLTQIIGRYLNIVWIYIGWSILSTPNPNPKHKFKF